MVIDRERDTRTDTVDQCKVSRLWVSFSSLCRSSGQQGHMMAVHLHLSLLLLRPLFFRPLRELWERDTAIALKVEAWREATSVSGLALIQYKSWC